MRVEQAIYGEVSGGHALRGTSGDNQIASSIASRLDLPDTAPAGVAWSPYVSGFAYGDHYVLARTFADAGAARSGMVFAHALIMPLAEVTGFGNLKPLFDRLTNSIDHSLNLAGFDLEDDADIPTLATDLAGTAAAFARRGQGPVVRL